jgi:signal transduction histidine kinase
MTASPELLTQDQLDGLAEARAIQRRTRRYVGDSVQVPLRTLVPADAAVVQALYDLLGGLFGLIAPRLDGGLGSVMAVRGFLMATGFAELVKRIDKFGATLDAATTSLELREVYHDVRGGGLPALLMHLDAVAAGEGVAEDLERIFVLCRDQLKIIRNAIPDLDPEGYARDLAQREHSSELLLAKWANERYRLRDVEVEVTLRCDFDGTVSECCMEFAALDRVIYNLVNNATRFAADGRVELRVFPLNDAMATDLRFVVINRVTQEHGERVQADIGEDLSRIFAGGYTTGGHGLGLRICGDFVSHGYGLPSLQAALDDGYIGARLLGDCFVAWFHWPARRRA